MRLRFFGSPACCAFCLLSRTCCWLPSEAGKGRIAKAVHSWLILLMVCALARGTQVLVGLRRRRRVVNSQGFRFAEDGRRCFVSQDHGNGRVVPMLRHVQ
jgi:hypothetical protein